MIYWRFMPEGLARKQQSAFAQILLKEALRKEYQIQILPEIKRTALGKPFFPEYPMIQFNYSHSKHAAVCVLSNGSVGIDLEKIRPFQEKTARRFCTDTEWLWLQKQKDKNTAWIRIWTAKEAYLKYTGTGIRTDLRCLDLSDALEAGDGRYCIQNGKNMEELYITYFQKEQCQITLCSEYKILKTICCL